MHPLIRAACLQLCLFHRPPRRLQALLVWRRFLGFRLCGKTGPAQNRVGGGEGRAPASDGALGTVSMATTTREALQEPQLGKKSEPASERSEWRLHAKHVGRRRARARRCQAAGCKKWSGRAVGEACREERGAGRAGVFILALCVLTRVPTYSWKGMETFDCSVNTQTLSFSCARSLSSKALAQERNAGRPRRARIINGTHTHTPSNSVSRGWLRIVRQEPSPTGRRLSQISLSAFPLNLQERRDECKAASKDTGGRGSSFIQPADKRVCSWLRYCCSGNY